MIIVIELKGTLQIFQYLKFPYFSHFSYFVSYKKIKKTVSVNLSWDLKIYKGHSHRH